MLGVRAAIGIRLDGAVMNDKLYIYSNRYVIKSIMREEELIRFSHFDKKLDCIEG